MGFRQGPRKLTLQRVPRPPPYAGRGHARGRHDPPRGEPDPPGARRARPGRDRDAASALRQGPLARAPRPGAGSTRSTPTASICSSASRATSSIHSHLRMTGWWGVFGRGERWRRSPKRAWLVLRAEGHEVVQFDGPVLDLMTASRTRFDQQLAALGPDVLAPEFDRDALPAAPARGRPDAPDRRRAPGPAHRRGARDDLADRGLLRRGARPVAPDRPGRRRRGDGRHRRGPAADGAQRGGRIRPRRDRDLRQTGAAVPALRPPRSGRVGRARTTVGHTGARDARHDPARTDAQAHRPQGGRPHRARQHARELRRRARGRRRHGRVRRAPRAPRRLGPARARPRLRASSTAARRSRSRRASPTSPRTRGPASSSNVDMKLAGYERAGGRRAARARARRAAR